MVGELDILNEWIPEQMQPGTVFVLENAGEIGEKEDPYWAVLSCPSCGMLGLITRKQINGLLPLFADPRVARRNSSFEIKKWSYGSPSRADFVGCSMKSVQPAALFQSRALFPWYWHPGVGIIFGGGVLAGPSRGDH